MQHLTRKILCLLSVLLLLLVGVSGAMEANQLQQLLVEADRNPALLAAYEQIAVVDSKVAQVTSLKDPVLSLALSNFPAEDLKTNMTPMTGIEVRIAQMFPFPGKLDAKGKVAAKKSRWFSSAYQDARLQVRQKVKDAWFRLLFQRQAIELTNRNLKLLDDFIKLTETRYEVGKGLQQNVLKAHLQRSKQLDMLLSLQQKEKATLAELNSLVGRETDQELATDVSLETLDDQFVLNELKDLAEEKRPLFTSYSALIDQYKAQRELALLDYKPDFTLWAGYRWRDDALVDGGPDFVSAGVSFNLPVRKSSRGAAVAEADSSLRLAFQKRSDFRNKVHLTIHRSLSKYEQASRLVELYDSGIIPQANQTFEATLSAYQVDKVDFLDLLDSVMSLYRYQIDLARAKSDQHRSRAQIEAAAGLAVDQLPPLPKSVEG